MAPLTSTAITGAIRVGGPPQMKALIGRARENRVSAELDFMSSTPHEVSEPWNGYGIVRTIGKSEVKRILFLEGCGPPKKFGLFTLTDAEKENLVTKQAYSDPLIDTLNELWRKKTEAKEENKFIKSPDNDSRSNVSRGTNSGKGHFKNDGLNRAPIISLNIHPKQNSIEFYDRQSGNRAHNSTENVARVIHSFQRVIGPSRSKIKRDLEWWAGTESAEALDSGHMEQSKVLLNTWLDTSALRSDLSLKAVQKLVEMRNGLFNECDLAGRTPLHYAVMRQKDELKQDNAEEIIKKLLDANAIPLQGRDGLVSFYWVVKTGNIEVTKLL
ncbi:hypothetical protein BPOR_0541g00060 [Botrytis porri]|uniref:Uncharacterized protein n=1 Tax=Botrytis porri TaxID=87229 RepID=A0A4Z1KR32_9HELO|nr:hypothetical protein BPOR_0541g00060 [Botrytis porri]